MHQHAVDGALEDAGVDQFKEAFDQHLADAVEALREGRAFLDREGRRARGEARHRVVEARIALMAQDHGVDGGIAFLADADLQRAAVRDQARDVDAAGVFRSRDRLLGRREERKVGRGAVQHVVEGRGRQIAVAGHEREF